MKIFNRVLFMGLAFVCLGSLTFLLLRTSSPQQLKNELIGLSENEKKYAKELQLSLRWNKEGKQVGQQTQPIREVLDWMEENAPAEWDTVKTHFWETLPSRNAPPTPFSEENWRTVDERVDIQYDTFFEALALLPENSLTLQMLFEESHDVAQETLYSEQKTLEAQPSPTDVPQNLQAGAKPRDGTRPHPRNLYQSMERYQHLPRRLRVLLRALSDCPKRLHRLFSETRSARQNIPSRSRRRHPSHDRHTPLSQSTPGKKGTRRNMPRL